MLIMFCSWKRLSQWVCYIQIRMYLANIYVSLLDLIMDGTEASLDVLGSLVKSGFNCLGKGIDISQDNQAHQETLQFHVQVGDIEICKIHTDLNVADPLTKPLPRAKHDQHQGSMGVRIITV